MSPLNPRERELVALGAALASNCVPCIAYHVDEARKAGISGAQVEEALSLADTIRKLPAEQVLSTARARLGDGVPRTLPPAGGARDCGCR